MARSVAGEGVEPPTPDEVTPNFVVRAMGEQGSGAAVLVVYRRDYDVLPSRGLRTVGYHLALVRRVAERRPDVQFVTYDRHRKWQTPTAVELLAHDLETVRVRDFIRAEIWTALQMADLVAPSRPPPWSPPKRQKPTHLRIVEAQTAPSEVPRRPQDD
jgi:hypothetical protein